VGRPLMPIAMPSGSVFGLAMVVLFFMLMSLRAIFIIYSYVNNQLDGLFFVITIFCSKQVRKFFFT
jgi:hypothetical protein